MSNKLLTITILTMILFIIGGCTVNFLNQPADRIIYQTEDTIMAMDENGQNQRVIWNCPDNYFECSNISPDWTKTVYLEQGEQVWNVRLKEREKADGRILMADVPQDKDFWSEWAPNSRDLAISFYSVIDGEQKDNELYLINVDTGEAKLLDTGIGGMTWSPDSRYIAYYDFRPQEPGWYVADLKTGDRIKVTDELVEGPRNWSPDSTQIALTISRPEAAIRTGTYVKNLKTGTLVGIQDFDQYNYYVATNPTWSPDGNNIAYIAEYDGAEGNRHPKTLFIHNIRSGKQTPLADDIHISSKIIWSPGSQKIIYESFYQDKNYYMIDINTKERTKILDYKVGHVIAWE